MAEEIAPVEDSGQAEVDSTIQFNASSMPVGLRDEPSLQTFDSVDKLAKSYVNAVKMIGGNPDNLIPLPQEGESWDSFYNQLGRPEQADGYDFGEDVDEKLIEFFKENNLKHIYLSFEGLPGYCKQEEDCDDLEYRDFAEKNMKRILKIINFYRDRMNKEYWVWQHPENRIIYDPHPSKRADKIAAKMVKEYIDEKYS